ncbi:6-pyruvoyl-tetrahydropterin synthase-related protein [Sphingobium aromaticiconvertens]|uniref:6-pyruvoyl-tetrahydropterin synthase-related protein n=1 Tax=Sphingobium aromaticiconvertens TaxID=365341 RepID=UPI003017D5CA
MDSILLRRLGLFAIVAAIIMMPTFLFGPGDSHSVAYNYIWTSQFGTEMAHGNFYPRWLPGSFEGLGSPTFYFYPPLAYWIAGAFDAIGFSTFAAINITAFLVLTLSGLAMYQWLAERGTWPRLGAILYMAAPYHLMDFYVRGALAEFTAFIWLPLIALAIARIPQRRGIWLLGLSYGGLILTHLPVAMLTGLFLIAPLALHRVAKDRTTLLPLLIGGALAIGLASFYLIPALTMQGDISSALLWEAFYRPSSWSLLAPNSLLKILPIPALAAGLVVLALPSRSIWTAIAVLVGVSALGLIPYMWDIAPLNRAQFPWRLLGILEFASITALLSRKTGPIVLGLGCGLIFFVYYMWILESADYLVKPVDYAMLARELPDAPEYLPAGFDTRLVREIDRKADLRAWRRIPPGKEINVKHSGDVMMRHAAFPIWRVTRDGVEVPHKGPIIHFHAEPGRYRIERILVWQEIVGMILTALSVILLLWVAFGAQRGRISLLSKFPAYSPFSAISGWPGFLWLGRLKRSGGAQ